MSAELLLTAVILPLIFFAGLAAVFYANLRKPIALKYGDKIRVVEKRLFPGYRDYKSGRPEKLYYVQLRVAGIWVNYACEDWLNHADITVATIKNWREMRSKKGMNNEIVHEESL